MSKTWHKSSLFIRTKLYSLTYQRQQLSWFSQNEDLAQMIGKLVVGLWLMPPQSIGTLLRSQRWEWQSIVVCPSRTAGSGRGGWRWTGQPGWCWFLGRRTLAACLGLKVENIDCDFMIIKKNDLVFLWQLAVLPVVWIIGIMHVEPNRSGQRSKVKLENPILVSLAITCMFYFKHIYRFPNMYN